MSMNATETKYKTLKDHSILKFRKGRVAILLKNVLPGQLKRLQELVN